MAREVGEPAVIARDLVLAYGERVALTASDFDIPAGALTALIGPNGSGKSTILNAIAGLLEPISGRLAVLAGPRRLAAIAYVLQLTAVDEAMPVTVREVVGMGRYGSLGPFRRFTTQDRALCAAAMDRLAIRGTSTRPDGLIHARIGPRLGLQTAAQTAVANDISARARVQGLRT